MERCCEDIDGERLERQTTTQTADGEKCHLLYNSSTGWLREGLPPDRPSNGREIRRKDRVEILTHKVACQAKGDELD